MTPLAAPFPHTRPRRLRRTPWIRSMVAETRLGVGDLIWPLFVREGTDAVEPIASLPGVSRLSVDRAVEAAREAADLGIPCIALFPYTEAADKNPDATEALNPDRSGQPRHPRDEVRRAGRRHPARRGARSLQFRRP